MDENKRKYLTRKETLLGRSFRFYTPRSGQLFFAGCWEFAVLTGKKTYGHERHGGKFMVMSPKSYEEQIGPRNPSRDEQICVRPRCCEP